MSKDLAFTHLAVFNAVYDWGTSGQIEKDKDYVASCVTLTPPDIRPHSESICDVALKSKYTFKCDVAKSFRMGLIVPAGNRYNVTLQCNRCNEGNLLFYCLQIFQPGMYLNRADAIEVFVYVHNVNQVCHVLL